MKYTITFPEHLYHDLNKHLFEGKSVEQGAYGLCKLSTSEEETRLLVREIIPVLDEDIEEASQDGMRIKNRSFLRAMKKADQTRQFFLWIHSHPDGYPNHSPKDDQEEESLFQTAYTRIKGKGVHGSLVLSSPKHPVARIWLEDSTYQPVSFIRVIGERFKFYSQGKVDPMPQFFDRQVIAFGEEFQKTVKQLHVGIVGVGGTGSAVKEQLVRLGVGQLTIIDGQTFESTNVNRIYGSKVADKGSKKVDIAKASIEAVGLDTLVSIIDKPISYSSAIEPLKNCDLIFGCTDDEWGRSLLNRLAVYYYIPVFDMGVKILSEDDVIESVQGRVTVIIPRNACLFCRGRLSPTMIEAEMISEMDPGRHQELVKQGYAAELEGTAPSVISFTSGIASLAVSEMIHRLTGFMGEEKKSNETLFFFDENRIRTNRQLSKEGCFCGEPYYMMRGDVSPFLDSIWRNENHA